MRFYPLIVALFACVVTNAQALVATVDLDLQKPAWQHQFLQVKHPDTNEFFVFASDKSAIHALRYNSALFYRDSLIASRPEGMLLIGSGFDAIGNPAAYWASEDFSTIRASVFDFESRVVNTAAFSPDFDDQVLIGYFSYKESFYLISVPKERDSLKFYTFSGGIMKSHSTDLSAIVFRDQGSAVSFDKLIARYQPQQVDNLMLNPLVIATSKIKFYISDKRLIFTLDHELHQTQVLIVDLQTFITEQKAIPQKVLASGPANSNSYLSGDFLYQLKANDAELRITITELATGDEKNSFGADARSGISFRSSPLLVQTGNQQARELKKTKRFFKILSASKIGISVYRSDQVLLTVGGVDYVASTGNVLLGVAAGAGMLLGGADVQLDELIGSDNLRTTFFESYIDANFHPVPSGQEVFAVDKVHYFLNENDVSNSALTKYDRNFLLGFYSSGDKKYILRRFRDNADR